ncbi:protein BatD [Alteromonas sp. 5E99-2]|uniref:BatD family protein n=1 Tax=Alteromonas sp. 5E99-2 TaxID=2817683 RepID=UPI001A99404C|nr:BatD family protein [Alteromonas sp. 5E99-2]MBO1256079.1 protein BatD [Alteromonas sp. 5E99-2]
MVKRTLLIITLAFLATPFAHALEVEASVDKNPVLMDEAIILTITATGKVNRNAFDSSPLLKDFIVSNTSTSSRTSIVNFDKTTTTTWQTTLLPKKIGQFVIPSLDIDGSATQPIAVQVIPVPDTSANEQRDFFVTGEIAQDDVYVQQHVKYVVKLHMAQNIESGSLQGPALEDASIEQVGEDNQYSDIINGKRFQIIERTYVIAPEKSGQFELQGPVFSGNVFLPSSSQSYSRFSRTQNIVRRGPATQINVKPIPSSFTAKWLPSEYVALSEEWSNDEKFMVGEPITRTLTLTVAGQNKEQLPEIEQFYPPFVKHYPDQPSTASAQKDGVILSQRKESTAIIPSKEGTLVIPGVEVTWFNTRTGQTEVASIPARSFQVLPAAESAANKGSPSQTQEFESAPEVVAQPAPVLVENKQQLLLWQIVSGVLGALWLITLFLLLRSKNKPPTARLDVKTKSVTLPISTGTLHSAIDNKESGKIQSQLLAWLQKQDNKQYDSLAEALKDPQYDSLNQALSRYMSGLYSEKRSNVDGEELKSAINALSKKAKPANANTGGLEPLYKL